MDRYAILNFLEALRKVSDDFVLKGGNLLWIYTKTPRETVDLDFSTLNLNSHLEVKAVIEKACYALEDICFEIESFNEMNHENMYGSRFLINFKANTGATNKFGLDIVYKLSTDLKKLKPLLVVKRFGGPQ